MKVAINSPNMKVKLLDDNNVNVIIPDTQRIPGTGGVKQVYRGEIEPIDENILIWIDTSMPPVIGSQLITSDDLRFITSDDKGFILEELPRTTLTTSDDKNFITSDDYNFILSEVIETILVTSDGLEFKTFDDEEFILKEE